MESSRKLIVETNFSIDEMAVTFDDYRKFEWRGIKDEFGIIYLACFENEKNEETKTQVISLLRTAIRKLLLETDQNSLFDPKQLLTKNKERCTKMIEEGLKEIKKHEIDEIDRELNELVDGNTDLETELRQTEENGPKVNVSSPFYHI